MIGTLERKIPGYLIYRSATRYLVFSCARLGVVSTFPRTVNVNQVQLRVWLLATGRLS